MSRARRVLLFATLLLLAAEALSLSLVLQRLRTRDAEHVRVNKAVAVALLPQIAEWIRNRGSAERTTDPWIDPFQELSVVGAPSEALPANRGLKPSGELHVTSQPLDRVLVISGHVDTPRGIELFQLKATAEGDSGLFTEGLLVAQHAFILIAGLAALILVGLARDPGTHGDLAIGAYEEAMSWLRRRDHDRLMAFEAEKAKLTSTLRDREAMARAGDLTAGIVHEVRNSIGAISAQAKLAQQAGDSKVQSAASAITSEVQSIQNVMNRFVSFIKTEEVSVAPFDLDRMVRRVVSREQSKFQGSIEAFGESVTVRGDEDLLERAVENIVRNACQAAGDRGRVTVRSSVLGQEVLVVVEDNGPGIEDSERALRPFESSRAGGLGLGLPLVLKILSLHQGTLDLAPRSMGTGTSAVCRWPVSPDAATIRNAHEPPPG